MGVLAKVAAAIICASSTCSAAGILFAVVVGWWGRLRANSLLMLPARMLQMCWQNTQRGVCDTSVVVHDKFVSGIGCQLP